MTDQREAILSRLVAVCGEVEGINAVGRNTLDVSEMLRPAVIVLDGSEQVATAALADYRAPTVSKRQIMQLVPQIIIALRGNTGAEGGTLLTLYRNRVLVGHPQRRGAASQRHGQRRHPLHRLRGAAARCRGQRVPYRPQYDVHLHLRPERAAMIDFNIKVNDTRIQLMLDQLPAKLQANLAKRIDALTVEAQAKMRAAEPHRTGRLQAETKRFVDERENWVRGRVRILGPGGRGHNIAAAALEYGSHKSIPVKGYRRGGSTVVAYRRRTKSPSGVSCEHGRGNARQGAGRIAAGDHRYDRRNQPMS